MLTQYSRELNALSEAKGFNLMYAIEWIRKPSGASAAKTYMGFWRAEEALRKAFKDSDLYISA